MIPAEYRMKGGALLLGARQPGEAGPFGAYRDDDQADEETPGTAVWDTQPHVTDHKCTDRYFPVAAPAATTP